jgi:hypothetical protein
MNQKFIRSGLLLALGAAAPSVVSAAIVGPYTADANTVYLYHFDEGAGASVAANAGSAGFNAVSYLGSPYAGDGIAQTTLTTVLGAAGFAGFGNAANLSGANTHGLGVDINNDGAFTLDDNAPIGTDRLLDHASIFGGGNVFTLEALISLPSITSGNRQIISTDGSAANTDRGIQFRVNGTGNLEFNFIGVNTSALLAPIPTTGDHAFVANEWFHAALTYDGSNARFYWTRVASQFTEANLIGGPSAEGVDVNDDAILVIGNEGRVVGTTGSTEGLLGSIDEVRISNIARGAQEMMLVPEPATWTLALGGIATLLAMRRLRSPRA